MYNYNHYNQRFMTISELEKLTGIDRRKIHYYLSKSLLDEPFRTGKTMAYYGQKHIQQLNTIKELRKKGYPLVQIRLMLKGENEKERKTESISQVSIGKKLQIVEKAVELFSKVGYYNTKISDITGALGMAPSSFYIYFPSKKALFLECLDQVFEAMFKDAIDDIRKERHPTRRLRLRAEIALKSHRQFFDVLNVLEVNFNDDRLVQEKRKEIYMMIKDALKRNLQWAVREGLFPPLNLDIVSYILIEVLKAAQLISSLGENFDVDEFLDTVDGLLFQR